LAILPAPNQGVVLEHCKGSVDAAEDGSSAKLPDDSSNRQVWKEAGLEAPGPGCSGEASSENPLMRAKLIVFEEPKVSHLCIGINHGLCDGSGICDIVQIWSHFCTNPDEPLPELLARRRVLGERVFQPDKPAKDTKELLSRLETEVGVPHNPFKLSTLLTRVVPRAIWCMSRQQEVELRVHASKLEALKKGVTSQHLEKDGEWVSKFELLCSYLILARRITSNGSDASENHNLHVACNLRSPRSKRFAKDYFGNAAFDFCEPMANLPPVTGDTTWTMDALVLVAKQVHKAVRHGLEDAETNACKTKDWYEAARHVGLKNTYDVWAPVVFDALRGDGTFVNSWDKRWLDCPMDESKTKASSMMAWFGVQQNLVVEVPRHSSSGDSTIYLALPPRQLRPNDSDPFVRRTRMSYHLKLCNSFILLFSFPTGSLVLLEHFRNPFNLVRVRACQNVNKVTFHAGSWSCVINFFSIFFRGSSTFLVTSTTRAVAHNAKRSFKWSRVQNSPPSSRDSFKMCSELCSDSGESFKTLPCFGGEFGT